MKTGWHDGLENCIFATFIILRSKKFMALAVLDPTWRRCAQMCSVCIESKAIGTITDMSCHDTGVRGNDQKLVGHNKIISLDIHPNQTRLYGKFEEGPL